MSASGNFVHLARLVLVVLATAKLAAAHGIQLHPHYLGDRLELHVAMTLARTCQASLLIPRCASCHAERCLHSRSHPVLASDQRVGPLLSWLAMWSWPTACLQLNLYMDNSCVVTASLTPYLALATGPDGAPYSDQKVYAYGFTGTCERGVGDLYRNNATLGDVRGNLMWWRDGVTSSNGTLWGSSPNIMVPRRPSARPNGLTSILIVPPPQHTGGPFCANFDWAAPVDDWLAATVANCTKGYMSSSPRHAWAPQAPVGRRAGE
ncbi:hypothetical protein QJQ45_029862, partial [Haematococcus lacustris]